MPPYTFQVLPYHPPIEAEESLSSYINRLIVGNRMSKMDFQQFLGKKDVFRYITGIDYGPSWLEPLSEISNVPMVNLIKGTLIEFMVNFDRAPRQQVVNQFLVNMISPWQRFCPLCLAEQSIYKLLWRFTTLKYCDKHKCEICDTCPNCHKTIPFIEAPNGICPSCNYALKDSPVQAEVSKDQQEVSLKNWRSFRYLFKTNSQIHVYLRQMMVGRTLKAIRNFNKLSRNELASFLGTTPRVLERGIEGPRIGSGETFEMYHRYAEYFAYSIGDIFLMVDTHLTSDDTTIFLRPTIDFDWGNWEVKTVIRVAENLARFQKDWSLTTFQAELGANYQKLSKFPLALAILDAYIRNDSGMDFVKNLQNK